MISIDDLAKTIVEEVQNYTEEVTEKVKEAVNVTTKELLSDVKKNSPSSTQSTGDYKKGWTQKTQYESQKEKRTVVYNRTNYQITHLLEKGFLHRSGKRVAPKPHIAPAEQKAIKAFEKRVEEAISGK